MKNIAKNNLIIFIIMIIINYLGASGFINGISQKDISDMYKTLVTPASYAFSIWSLIYICIFFSFFILYRKIKDEINQKTLYNISNIFKFSCILNIIWVISYSLDLMTLSFLIILILTITIILINSKLKNREYDINESIIPFGFGVYAGWLSVATIANLFNLLSKENFFNSLEEECLLAIITLFFASVIISLIGLKLKNVLYYLASSWALISIFVEIISSSYSNDLQPFLSFTVLILGLLKLVEAIVLFLKNDKSIIKI